MKKYKKIAYVFLIVIVSVLSVTIYANASKEDRESKKEKNFSEVEFLETKLLNLANEINNIETRNYNISASEISNQAEDQKNSESSQGNTQGGNSQKSNSQEGSSNSGTSSSNSNKSSDTESKSSQKFDLVEKGILTNSEDVNWKDVKNEIEILYSSIPTITLDLYQSNTNQEDILNFNKEFDNLTMVVKEEKKQETLSELSKLYDYIPKFMENSTDDQLQKTVTETKSKIIKAYSKLGSKNWDEISNDIKQAIDIYSKLLTDTSIDQSKQYTISKVYIMINELQNAVQMQDESIFLIKYKNIIEEMNTLL